MSKIINIQPFNGKEICFTLFGVTKVCDVGFIVDDYSKMDEDERRRFVINHSTSSFFKTVDRKETSHKVKTIDVLAYCSNHMDDLGWVEDDDNVDPYTLLY